MSKPQRPDAGRGRSGSKGPVKPAFPIRLYRVGPGNNAALVDRVIRSRPWWRRVPDDKTRPQFIWQQSSKGLMFDRLNAQQLANHLPWGIELGSKMRLFQNCSRYLQSKGKNPFSVFPVTYLINPGERNDLALFEQHFEWLEKNKGSKAASVTTAPQAIRKACKKTPPEENEHNIWIVKPLGFNRGLGITVVNEPQQAIEWMKKGQEGHIKLTNDVEKLCDEEDEGAEKGKLGPRITKWVIQKYIEHPLLFNGRKFDLRVYMLVTGKGDAFFYRDGYLRMASSMYSSEDLSREVHLTNNAVQKRLSSYGTDEAGNMRTLGSLDEYVSKLLLERNGNNRNPDGSMYSYVTQYLQPRMREIIAYAAASAVIQRHSDSATAGCFELYGVDFMIDDSLNIYLIEMNVNPCLELACNVSWSILPYLLDDVLALTLDTQLPMQPSIFTSELTKRKFTKKSQGFVAKEQTCSPATSPKIGENDLKLQVGEEYDVDGKDIEEISPSSATTKTTEPHSESSSSEDTRTKNQDTFVMDKKLKEKLLLVGDKVLLKCDNDLQLEQENISPAKSRSRGKSPMRRTSASTTPLKRTKSQQNLSSSPSRVLRSTSKSVSPTAKLEPARSPGSLPSEDGDKSLKATGKAVPSSPKIARATAPHFSSMQKSMSSGNLLLSPQRQEPGYVPPKTFPYDAWPTWAGVPRPTWPVWASLDKEQKDKEAQEQSKEEIKAALNKHVRLRWDAVVAKGDYAGQDSSEEKLSKEDVKFLQGFRHRPNNFEMVMSKFRPLKVRHVKLELPVSKNGKKNEASKISNTASTTTVIDTTHSLESAPIRKEGESEENDVVIGIPEPDISSLEDNNQEEEQKEDIMEKKEETAGENDTNTNKDKEVRELDASKPDDGADID